MDLFAPIETVPRVTVPYQKRLKKLGINTVRDLIFYFPHRYEDFSNLTRIQAAKLNQIVCLKGKIIEITNRRTWVKRIVLTEAIVQDETGAIKVVWFNQPYLTKNLKEGDEVCLAGKILMTEGGAYLSNPAYEKISGREPLHTGRIIPIYPETRGVSSRWLRYILRPILAKTLNQISEVLPQEVVAREKLLPIKKALWQIHFPDSMTLVQKAKQRFSFEELFLLQLLVLKQKIKIAKEKASPVNIDVNLMKKFTGSLPFKLTNAQKKAAWQILKDMEKQSPMSRLLQGDVGSGKTVVATMAALNTVKAGYQVALMAPTEILAKQHFSNISRGLTKFGINVAFLSGKEAKIFRKKEEQKITRSKLLEKIKTDDPLFLIGTHALIQKPVKFDRLGLVILDEQHRFGTEQRAGLIQQKDTLPHLLSMTATPIPRSLALTIYGDLDLCLIDEMPKGRKKIITKIIPPRQRKQAYQFIRKQIEMNRQAFVVCPRIEIPESSEKQNSQTLSWAEVRAVKKEYDKLTNEIFPDLKVAMLHGKMKSSEKEKIMQDFQDKKSDILVSTSVVEVGVDIVNASVMMIEGAERFGLAQLHQFRGRVGRGQYQSYCLLFTDSSSQTTRQRLSALVRSENGFKLAEKDLKIRGPGDFLGKRQSGLPDLVMASLVDLRLVEKTREIAKQILTQDVELKKYPALRARIAQFQTRIHLE